MTNHVHGDVLPVPKSDLDAIRKLSGRFKTTVEA